MGFRAHIREKSIIKHDDLAVFNCCSEELADFVKQECENAVISDFWGEDVGTNWEIPVDEVKTMIKNLKENWEPNEEVFKGYVVQDIIDFFERALIINTVSDNFSDPDYIYIDWY